MGPAAKQAKIVRRRGRPTPERIAEIDAAIRAAALELFIDLGFDGASMDAIALKAGVSKGTLYARYEAKEPLFHAVLEDELERWSKRAGGQDHLLPRDLVPRLRHHARTLIEVFDWPEYQRIARLTAAAAPTLPNVSHHWEEIGTKRYLRFLAGDMARAAGGGDVDWDYYARLFLFAIAGWHRAEASGGSVDREAMAAFAERVIATIDLAIRVADRPD